MTRHFTPKDLERAKAFFAKKKLITKLPGMCCSCGKPVDRENRKTCTRCVKRMVERARKKKRDQARLLHGESLQDKLEGALRDIQQLRKEMSRLREATFKIKNHRDALYQTGYRAGIRRGIKTGVKCAVKFQERFEAGERQESLGEITRQELATMNHAYER